MDPYSPYDISFILGNFNRIAKLRLLVWSRESCFVLDFSVNACHSSKIFLVIDLAAVSHLYMPLDFVVELGASNDIKRGGASVYIVLT